MIAHRLHQPIASLRARFEQTGRVEIPGFLNELAAAKLRQHLIGRTDWTLVVNAGTSVYELSRAAQAALTDAQRSAFEEKVHAAGRQGFQYRYEAIRVPDDANARSRLDAPLLDFVRAMGSRETLDLLRQITGCLDIDFADGQATAYSPGHFLTRHDDDVHGKNRRLAYVLGLSPGWRAEWGGLLMFHREDGKIDEAFVPAIGTLRLFRVPSVHSVSYVTPLAPEPRLAITGWLRTEGVGA